MKKYLKNHFESPIMNYDSCNDENFIPEMESTNYYKW